MMRKKFLLLYSFVVLAVVPLFPAFPSPTGDNGTKGVTDAGHAAANGGLSGGMKNGGVIINRAAASPKTPEKNASPLLAVAGPDQLVDEKTRVFLDASNSWPLDVSTTMVFWKQLEGPWVQLSNPEDIRPCFIAPEVGPEGAALVFELTLSTDEGAKATDTCIVNVSWGNIQPSADAGESRNARQGNRVVLNGAGSWDADGKREELKYEWRQIDGPRVVLSNPFAVNPSFIAPFTIKPVETLIFELVVTDKGGLKGSDRTIVNVAGNDPVPVADAGPDGIYDEGTAITLDGSNSYSRTAPITAYFWTQLQGPPVTLSDPTSIKPTFLSPPVKGFETVDLVFALTVTDESGLKASNKTRVRVDDNWLAPFAPQAVMVPVGDEAIGFEVEQGGSLVYLVHSATPRPVSGNVPETPYGLFDLQIRTYEPGGEVSLRVFLPRPAPPGYRWLKWEDKTGWTTAPADTVFNAERTAFTIKLKDGGPCDEDGTENGLIVDPSGLGDPTTFSITQSTPSGTTITFPVETPSPQRKRLGDIAGMNLKRLSRLISVSMERIQAESGPNPPQGEALFPSHVGWNWLFSQFGPALPVLLVSILIFVGFVLLKRILCAVIPGKERE